MTSVEWAIMYAGRYLVSGIIVNDPNGPKRWAEWVDADSPQQAEDIARVVVAEQQVEGRSGRLWVANVFQLTEDDDGQPAVLAMDTYAVYADDYTRSEGVAPIGGYVPMEYP